MEDHGGELMLEDGELEGARVRLVFAAEARTTEGAGAASLPLELSAVGHGA
jgi:hypothetical protein